MRIANLSESRPDEPDDQHEKEAAEQHRVHSRQLLPTRPIPNDMHPSNNVMGVRRGFVTVVGLARDHDKHVLWVVQCDCGAYEHRRTRILKKPNTPGLEDCCMVCRQNRDRLKGKQ